MTKLSQEIIDALRKIRIGRDKEEARRFTASLPEIRDTDVIATVTKKKPKKPQ